MLLRRRSEPLQPWWSGVCHISPQPASRFPTSRRQRGSKSITSTKNGTGIQPQNWWFCRRSPHPEGPPTLPVRILQNHHQASLPFSGNRQELLNTRALKMALFHQRRITYRRSHNKRVSSMHHRCHASHTSHQVNALRISFSKNEVSLDMVYWYTLSLQQTTDTAKCIGR